MAAGLDLGRRVAELATARARTDGSDAAWTGSVSDEPGTWHGTKPVEPLAGTWQTWVLTSGDQFRPGPPPAYDSDQLAREPDQPQAVRGAARSQPAAGRARLCPAERGLLRRLHRLLGDPPQPARADGDDRLRHAEPPSYPAAHACVGGAMETVLGALFPRDAAYFARVAEDESWSRLWAGIHFRSDIEVGRALGRSVGQAAVAWAAKDGAD